MLFHNIKYNTLASVREKSIIFWLMLFPVVLATFFHVALIGVYDKDILFISDISLVAGILHLIDHLVQVIKKMVNDHDKVDDSPILGFS